MSARAARLVAAILCLPLAGACASSRATTPAATPAPSPSTVGSDADARLGAAFDARFAAADRTALWAVRLERLEAAGTPRVLASRNDDRLMVPASNMKIVTLATAAARLGWDYRFRTRLYGTGTRDGHVLRGDLVVVGGADPTIGRGDDPLATMRGWARALREQGVRRVEGDLVGDPSRFGDEWLGDSWSWDDLPAGYAAPYSGLTFNENVVSVRVAPGAAAGAPVAVTTTPAAYGVRVVASARTAARGEASTLSVTRDLGTSVVRITGAVPVGAAPVSRTTSVADPALFFLGALREALADEGIEIRGTTRVEPRPETDTLTPLIVHESAPLSQVAQRFMKVSQNLYGEVLLRVAAAAGPSPADAATTVQQALASFGVEAGSVQERDGSGLSRRDFVTARAITTLLQALARGPHREPFRATLPVAGQDGTLASRFRESPCSGRLVAKTGSLSHVRSLSGYVTSTSGHTYVFSVIANNYLAPTRDIDAIADGALALVCGA